MLEQLSDQVRNCHERAAEAKAKADATDDPALKAELLDMERRWLTLARSYGFTESLGDFSAANSEWRRKFNESLRANAGSALQTFGSAILPVESELNTGPLAGKANMCETSSGNTDSVPRSRSMLSTDELMGRQGRPPDYAAECHSLIALAQEMAVSPDSVLERLVETAMALCGAHSAGVSLLEESDQKKNFHWRAISGRWAAHVNGSTPRDFSPCGVVLDRNVPLLCSHPERDFPYFGEVEPLCEEAVLVPFYAQGEAVGTVWVVAHDKSKQFDAEDLRLLTHLSDFASAGYQVRKSMHEMQYVSAVVEFSDDAIITKNLNSIIQSWNKAAERVFGYTAEEVIGKPITILIPPDRPNEEPAILERLRRGERIEHYETVRQRKDGSLIDISITVSPVKNTQGKIIGVSKIARDISERKRSDQQIATLAREAEHRTKNILATVQATVNLSHSDTPDGLKQAIEGRIHSLANVHSLFVKARWRGAELSRIAAQELSPYLGQNQGRVRIDGPEVLLEPTTAQAIAVILHELATNAAKYGSLSVPKGRVEMTWLRASDRQLILLWTESGGPPAKKPVREGFGTRVIGRMIREQLKGEIRLDWRTKGLACEIILQV
jgi:PAS domain S-box-containing protein